MLFTIQTGESFSRGKTKSKSDRRQPYASQFSLFFLAMYYHYTAIKRTICNSRRRISLDGVAWRRVGRIAAKQAVDNRLLNKRATWQRYCCRKLAEELTTRLLLKVFFHVTLEVADNSHLPGSLLGS